MKGYITPQGAQNLATYSYSGVDHSIIGNYILKHYWNWLIDHVVPPFVAPNVLTLCGLLCVVGAYVLLWQYTPGVEGYAPEWVYFVVAILSFAYQTFDNLDGKQARKTGSSSALGEVFDHGGDALATPLLVITLTTAMQFGPVLSFVSLLMFITIFYLAHWESYFTGVLVLRPLGNPTEANIVVVTILIITSFKGSFFWNESVNTILFGEVQWKTIMFVGACIAFASSILDYGSNVIRNMRSRQMRVRAAFLYLIPFTILIVCAVLWAWLSPVVLMEHPRLFLVTIGLIFGYLSIRQIVHSVCKEPFKLYYNVLSPPFLIAINSIIGAIFSKPVLDHELVLSIYFVVILLNVCFMVWVLIAEFCFYLGIRAFLITPKSPTPPAAAIQLEEV